MSTFKDFEEWITSEGIRIKIVVNTKNPGIEGHPIAISWFAHKLQDIQDEGVSAFKARQKLPHKVS